jgi:hypothetical protein
VPLNTALPKRDGRSDADGELREAGWDACNGIWIHDGKRPRFGCAVLFVSVLFEDDE